MRGCCREVVFLPARPPACPLPSQTVTRENRRAPARARPHESCVLLGEVSTHLTGRDRGERKTEGELDMGAALLGCGSQGHGQGAHTFFLICFN